MLRLRLVVAKKLLSSINVLNGDGLTGSKRHSHALVRCDDGMLHCNVTFSKKCLAFAMIIISEGSVVYVPTV